MGNSLALEISTFRTYGTSILQGMVFYQQVVPTAPLVLYLSLGRLVVCAVCYQGVRRGGRRGKGRINNYF
jgi:hypothetical protein